MSMASVAMTATSQIFWILGRLLTHKLAHLSQRSFKTGLIFCCSGMIAKSKIKMQNYLPAADLPKGNKSKALSSKPIRKYEIIRIYEISLIVKTSNFRTFRIVS